MAPPPQASPRSPGKSPRKRRGRGGDDDEYYGRDNRPLQKPPDQEKLADGELKEEFIRSLTTYDPLKSRNLVVWDNKESSFMPYTEPEVSVFILTLESELLSKDGADVGEVPADDLMEDDSDKEVEEGFEHPVVVEVEVKRKMPGIGPMASEDVLKEEEKEVAVAAAPEPAEDDDADDGGGGDAGRGKKLLNQFNYCERSSQTTNHRHRDHHCQTEPPDQTIQKDQCTLYVIFDAYKADIANQKRMAKLGITTVDLSGGGDEHKEEEGEKKPVIKEIRKEKMMTVAERPKVRLRKKSAIEGQAATDVAYAKSAECLRFLERLVASNSFEDVLYDFKYFEDNSDGYRDNGEGTVLPLWRFLYDKAKKKHVTCISWSNMQPDVFAVSYGCFSFIHPIQTGLVVMYSLRNPLFPEHVWQKDKGVFCCHIHRKRNSLVCIGLSDGNVVVLNLQKDSKGESQTEVFENYPLALKHSAPIWTVQWGQDDMDANPTFYSAGMDGKIMHWTMGVSDADGNGGLKGAAIASLILPQPPVDGPDGTNYQMFGCARCIAFHPTELTTLLVGTAEGKIFIASSLYGDKLLKIFNAHFLPVASIQWNLYHFEVFISCSEDWTIKVWDRRDLNPLFIFETGVPIMDSCWAPYSSSVFGCITLEGKLLVYDLNVNREKPICTQQVATKKKIHPHRMQFNPRHPIVVVGDDRGSLLSLKLSPNLRILPKDTRGIFLEGDVRIKWEINKMIRIMKLVRDPSVVSNPKPDELPLITNLAEIPGQLSRAEN